MRLSFEFLLVATAALSLFTTFTEAHPGNIVSGFSSKHARHYSDPAQTSRDGSTTDSDLREESSSRWKPSQFIPNIKAIVSKSKTKEQTALKTKDKKSKKSASVGTKKASFRNFFRQLRGKSSSRSKSSSKKVSPPSTLGMHENVSRVSWDESGFDLSSLGHGDENNSGTPLGSPWTEPRVRPSQRFERTLSKIAEE